MVRVAESTSHRLDLRDVVWRTDLRTAKAVALDLHLRRVVERHTILTIAVRTVVAAPRGDTADSLDT
jgi:hypothetical protein